MTLIDICIPLHSCDPAHLDALLGALAAQTLTDFTVCVSDDSTSPSATHVIDEYVDRLRIVSRRTESHLTMVGNWNRAVSIGSAPYAMLVGQDDVLVPTAVERLHDALHNEAGAVLCSSARTFIDEAGLPYEPRLRLNDRSRIFRSQARYTLQGRELARLCLRNGNAYGEPSSVMFRRADFEAVGGFDSHCQHAIDADFNIRMAQRGVSLYLNQPYLCRRRHSGAQTLRNVATGASSLDRVRLLQRHGATAGLTPGELGRCQAAIVTHSLFDLLRAAAHRNVAAVRVNGRILWQMRDTPPGSVCLRSLELLRGRNQDEQ